MVANSPKKKKGGSWKDTMFSILIVVLFIGLVGFLIFTNVKINQKRSRLNSRIETLKKEIQVLEEKNKDLKQGVLKAGSEEHLEKVAREQLGMKSPGEEVVVISKEEEKESSSAKASEDKNFWNPKYWWEWLTGSEQ